MSLMERRVTDKTETEAEIEEGEIAGEVLLATDRAEARPRLHTADTLPKQEKPGHKYDKHEKKPLSASPSSKQPGAEAQGEGSAARGAWGSPSSKAQFDNPYGVYTEMLMTKFDGHDERRRGGNRASNKECEGGRGVGKDVVSRGSRGGRGGEDEHVKAGARGGVAQDERDYRKLLENVKSLTKHVSVQDAMKALDAVCRDVKISVKKLEKAWRMAQKRRGLTSVDQCSEIVPLIERVFSGLRAVNAVAGTGVGRSQNLTSARDVMRAAMNYRHILFTPGMKKELEGWVRNSSLYAAEEKEKDKDKGKTREGGGGGDSKRASNDREHHSAKEPRRRGGAGCGAAPPHSNAPSDKKARAEADREVRFSAGQTGGKRYESEKSVKGGGPPPPPPPLPATKKDSANKKEGGGEGGPAEVKPRKTNGNEAEKRTVKQEGGGPVKWEWKTKVVGNRRAGDEHRHQQQSMGGDSRRRKREDRPSQGQSRPTVELDGGGQGTKRKGPFMESDHEKKPKRAGESTSSPVGGPSQPLLAQANVGESVSQQKEWGGQFANGVVMGRQQNDPVNELNGGDDMDVDGGVAPGDLEPIRAEQVSADMMVIDGESGGSNRGGSAERLSRQEIEEGPSTPLSTKSGSDCHRSNHQASVTHQEASPSSLSKLGPSEQGLACLPHSSGTVASSYTSEKQHSCEPRENPNPRGAGEGSKAGGTNSKDRERGSDLKHHQDSISEGGSLKYVGHQGTGDEGGSSLATNDPLSAPPSTSSRCEPSSLTESDQPTSNWGKPAPAGSFGRERPPSDMRSTPSVVENGDLPNGAPLGLSSADNVASDLPESISSLRGVGQGIVDPVESMLSKGKLCLVLDLDHTLLNSCKFDELGEEDTMRLEAMLREENRKPEHSRELFKMGTFKTWTKLRPGLRSFLTKVDECFELWIHTQRSRPYADAVVRILDPTGALFENRVIAQGSHTMGGVKSLGGGLKGRESLVLILDDTTSEWGNENRNLFAVERYLYFPVSRKRFGMPGKSLLQARKDEIPTRGMLMIALGVAMHAHRQAMGIFRSPLKNGGAGQTSCNWSSAWDIRAFLQAERKKVLSGVHLVFSHVIPIGQPLEVHPLWKLAEQFGAVCSSKCTASTTHVVAMMPGTEKVAWAKANNRYVVAPNWLECCCTVWRRVNEERFAIV